MLFFQEWRVGNRYTTTLACGTFDFPALRPKSWFKAVSAFILSTTGMILQRIKTIHSLKRTDASMPLHTHVPDACAPDGLISFHSPRPLSISPNCPRQN